MNKTFYKGTELKFKVTLECPGFSMENDDFSLDIVSGKTKVTLEKEDLAVVGEEGSKEYYAYVETDDMPTGNVKVIATAFVPDEEATGAIRKEIAVAQLCTLINP